MDLAVRQEGHPDNLGASLHGGVTVTCWDDETRSVVSLPVPEGVEFAVLVPDFEASTAAARAALPASYPKGDAVYNVIRVALLVAAWTQARWDVVGQAMSDRLHQPYRGRAMFPWLEGVMAAARGAGAMGAALSGAGPSVLGLAPAGAGAAVASAMIEALRRAGHSGSARVMAADTQGAQVERLA
jgi:homoserine kinase